MGGTSDEAVVLLRLLEAPSGLIAACGSGYRVCAYRQEQ
ncbi:hypothetical protein C4K24_3381 [Pseudomonas chlororaphis subsp. aurantiaca]|nr:hypothetical protein C4K24_3381 [Pseudomonas chlororaphis subsp. aurantiaca]AZD48894.1 hypothetical protein C4K20_3479 [Pseudomonas chlororaphis subsp. aurantiaca]